MALYYELPVYRDTYQLILKIFSVTKDFPKEYKDTLGQDMKGDGGSKSKDMINPCRCEFIRTKCVRMNSDLQCCY